MTAAQSRHCLISGVVKNPRVPQWARVGFQQFQGPLRRGFHAAVIGGMLLTGCGSVQCDLLGSDSLRRQCDGDGFMVTVYSTPTWYPGQELRDLWQGDKTAQERGL